MPENSGEKGMWCETTAAPATVNVYELHDDHSQKLWGRDEARIEDMSQETCLSWILTHFRVENTIGTMIEFMSSRATWCSFLRDRQRNQNNE